jgi:hypothetical protein
MIATVSERMLLAIWCSLIIISHFDDDDDDDDDK